MATRTRSRRRGSVLAFLGVAIVVLSILSVWETGWAVAVGFVLPVAVPFVAPGS